MNEPQLPDEAPFRSAGGPGAASALTAASRCSETRLRQPLADLTWVPARASGSEQRVLVSVFSDGLEQRRFLVSAALPPTQSTLTWERVTAGIVQYWWVLTRQPDGWAPSEAATFDGQICIADMTPP